MKPSLFATILFASALGGTCFAQGAPTAPAAGAAAVTPAATPPTVQLKHGYDPNTVICKWTEEIGTRLGRSKVCMNRAQWEQQSRDAQDDLNDTVHRGRSGAGRGLGLDALIIMALCGSPHRSRSPARARVNGPRTDRRGRSRPGA